MNGGIFSFSLRASRGGKCFLVCLIHGHLHLRHLTAEAQQSFPAELVPAVCTHPESLPGPRWHQWRLPYNAWEQHKKSGCAKISEKELQGVNKTGAELRQFHGEASEMGQ